MIGIQSAPAGTSTNSPGAVGTSSPTSASDSDALSDGNGMVGNGNNAASSDTGSEGEKGKSNAGAIAGGVVSSCMRMEVHV